MRHNFAEQAQKTLLSFNLPLINRIEKLVLVHKAILEFDVGVLVNEPGILVDGCNRELSEFGMDALNYGENV